MVHVGDFENDGRAYTATRPLARCHVPTRVFAPSTILPSVKHPFILTPVTTIDGLSWRTGAQFDLELLAKVRTMFFPDGRSLGQRSMPVISQTADPQFGKFRENLRWSMAGVTFVTLHIVGSNDNFGRTPEMDAEHRERTAANIVWLRKAFSEAKASNSRGLALLTQANPNFENYWPIGQKIPTCA